jgi:hypothetical protein
LSLLRVTQCSGYFRIAIHAAAERDHAFIRINADLTAAQRRVRANPGLYISGDLRIGALVTGNIGRL